ncbi:hypothetical protein ABZ341_41660 [Streptomyces sp. NPDC006173]|uniref:hypothetical protein n=1 Tax=Streptomyces sp. NPDC006173 TaxID=3155349 RepID=UPI0033CA9B2D
MAFRNPVRSLPADRITGQIQGSQLAADAIDGKVITGSTIRTGLPGTTRILLAPSGNLYFYTGNPDEVYPARIDPDASGKIGVYGPRMDDILDYGLTLKMAGTDTTATLDVDKTTVVGDLDVGGEFHAGNMRWGTVSVTPVPNVDTSLTVTGVGMIDASSYRVWVSLNSGFPSVLKPATVTSASADGFTVWINRTTNAPTSVWWLMLAQ